MKSIIGHGAEAIVRKEGNEVVKERVAKAYRHPQLDKQLRTSRSKAEKRLLEKASKLINVPKVTYGDNESIRMEHVDGPVLKEVLENNLEFAKTVGQYLAKLHDNDIIHGDLTTSNILIKKNEIVFIDFGLAYRSKRIEDKAVDIHVFKQALESKHHKVYNKAYKEFLKGYKESKQSKEILDRLRAVEARGRNKAKS